MKEADVTLRIVSNNKTIDMIIKILGVLPIRGTDKNSSLKKQIRADIFAKQTFWLLDSKMSRQEPLEKHIAEMVIMLEEHGKAIKTLQSDCEIDLFCYFSSING